MVVPTKVGNVRIIMDYKRLHRAIVVGKLPIPRINVVFDSLGEEKMFSTFDLASGFLQNAILP